MIRETCKVIAETPGAIGHRRAELGRGIRSFPVPPHVIFFRFTEDWVEVVRILHGRRDVRRELF
jgi:toxin ParE1/3/4